MHMSLNINSTILRWWDIEKVRMELVEWLQPIYETGHREIVENEQQRKSQLINEAKKHNGTNPNSI
jgi:hypothetical protein